MVVDCFSVTPDRTKPFALGLREISGSWWSPPTTAPHQNARSLQLSTTYMRHGSGCTIMGRISQSSSRASWSEEGVRAPAWPRRWFSGCMMKARCSRSDSGCSHR